MVWEYIQPVQIVFGDGKINELKEYTKGMKRILLVTGSFFSSSLLVRRIKSSCSVVAIFDKISPNPDVAEVNDCSKLIREERIDGIIALGGGSTIDLAKAASVRVEKIEEFYLEGKEIPDEHIPLIAIPTTAGTGSEVTSVAVLTDRRCGRKAPIASNSFYPKLTIVDPELTWTLSPYLTAVSGIDVLCHAVEGYWSKGHQPICDALALHAVKEVLEYLPIAYQQPRNRKAREKMAEASIIAGMAFAYPKTTSSHACSFPLTNHYRIPHGEACGLTLDYFVRINESDVHFQKLLENLHFKKASDFADCILNLKKELNLRIDLRDYNLSKKQIEGLVAESQHPNLRNNPVFVTEEMLEEMYVKLSK